MNIKELREIVNSNHDDRIIEIMVIESLSRSENVIPIIMKLLNKERQIKREIQNNLNELVCKSYVGLNNKDLNKDDFMQKDIEGFFKEYSKYISPVFGVQL